MSRIINSSTPLQQRTKLLKLISEAVHVLEDTLTPRQSINDLIAFIILSLIEIEKTIAQSTIPWEKREYWVKADQFRNEWRWVGEIKDRLLFLKTEKGWKIIPPELSLLSEKTKDYSPLNRMKGKAFWEGAFAVLSQK